MDVQSAQNKDTAQIRAEAEQDLQDEGIKTALFLSGDLAFAKIQPSLEAGCIPVGYTLDIGAKADFLENLTPANLLGHSAIVLDISRHASPLWLLCEVRERCPAQIKIVAIGNENDLGFYRQALAAGADEYFAQPLPVEELLQAMRVLLKLDAYACSLRLGRMITVFGTHGGVGCGMVAAGLAQMFALGHGRSTVLVDSNLSSPTVGSSVGSDLPGNLGFLLDDAEEIDSVLVDQIMQRPFDNLAFLDGYDGIGVQRSVKTDNVESLIKLLGNQFRYQVWRANGGSGVLKPVVLGQADIVFLVMSGTLSSARTVPDVVQWLADNNPAARLVFVYNTPFSNPPVPAESFEDLTGRKIYFVIPYQKGFGEAQLKNTTFNQTSHCMHKVFSSITRDILGVQSPHCSWLRRIFR